MLKRIRSAVAFGLVLALAPTAMYAQSKPKTAQKPQTVAELSDHFMPHILEMNAAEVAFGRLAMDKAQNRRVKEYAEMLVRVHSNTLANLGGLEHTGDLTRTMTQQDTYDTPGKRRDRGTPTTREKATPDKGPDEISEHISAEDRQTLNRLRGLSAARFDREFIDVMIEDHKKAIEFLQTHVGEFTEEASTARSPETRRVYQGFAMLSRDLLPVMQGHLKEAQSIQRDLRSGTNRDR